MNNYFNGSYYSNDFTFEKRDEIDDEDDDEENFVYDDKPYIYQHPKSNVILNEKTEYYILVDSSDRDLTTENLFNFKINFSTSQSGYEKVTIKTSDANENILKEIATIERTISSTTNQTEITLLQTQKKTLQSTIPTSSTSEGFVLYSGRDKCCHTQTRYLDIDRVNCEKIIMPSYDFLNKEIFRSKSFKINGQNIIYMNIQELQSNLDGSNNTIYSSYQVLVPEDTDHFNNILFYPVNYCQKFNTPINLSSLTFELKFASFTNTKNILNPDKYSLSAMCFHPPLDMSNPSNVTGSMFEFFLTTPCPITYISEGNILAFYYVTLPENNLIFIQQYFDRYTYYPVVEITSINNLIYSFKIPAPALKYETILVLIDKMTTPYIFKEKQVFGFNLSLQYQILLKISKTIPILNTERYPKTK